MGIILLFPGKLLFPLSATPLDKIFGPYSLLFSAPPRITPLLGGLDTKGPLRIQGIVRQGSHLLIFCTFSFKNCWFSGFPGLGRATLEWIEK